MEEVKSVETLVEKAVEYGKTSLELFKLKAVDKTALLVSSILAHAIFLIVGLTFILFMSVGAALWIGGLVGSAYCGFFIVGGFYGLLWVVLHFFVHQSLRTMISNYMLKLVL